MEFSAGQKINWIRNLSVIAFLVLMVYAPKLWIATKDFPVIPLFENFIQIAYPFDYLLGGILFLGLLIYLFKPYRALGLTTVALFVFLGILDQNRLQPYFYQSILTILFISLYDIKKNKPQILSGIYLIFFATYFWSGIQKFNDTFYEHWLRALLKHFDYIPLWILQGFTYAVPWLEMIIGLFLLFNKTRKWGVVSIIGMHSIIVAMLFYLGYGYNVVPWNLQNIISVYILFWGLNIKDNPMHVFVSQLEWKKAIIISLTFILPFTNIFGGWDHLLSFSFFSAKLNYYLVLIEPALADQMPEHIQKHFIPYEGKQLLYVQTWATANNRVLFYPEERCIHYLDAYLLSFGDDLISEKPLTEFIVWNR